MNATLEAALWGAIAALPLLLGAMVALRFSLSRKWVGLTAAFGAGALISAVSFDLVLDASEEGQPWALAIGLALGALAYWVGDRLIAKKTAGTSEGKRGLPLLMGAVLDGIPESFILGLTVASGLGVSAPFVVAVAISNLPEGMTSTASLKDDPKFSSRKLLALWAIVVLVCATVAGVGGWMGDSLPIEVTVLAQSFAAGALLTMITDALIPDADQDVGSVAGLAVATGFAVAFGLYQLGG